MLYLDSMKTEALGYLSGGCGSYQVLFIRINQNWDIDKLLLSEELLKSYLFDLFVDNIDTSHLQFLLSFIKPLGISRVYHVYQNVSIVEVVSPVWSNLSLTPDVPNIELEPLTLYRLDVKT